MRRRWITLSAKILGIILAILLLLIVVGPFLVPVNAPEGLVDAQQVTTDASEFITIPFDGTDGIDLHYIYDDSNLTDDEPTFVLLHGSLFNALTWNEVFEFFSQRGRVLAYDQIPYGLSQKMVDGDWTGESPYSPEAAVEQLFALLDELGIGRAVLVGHSYGGSLAIQAALSEPDRVEALILVGAAPYVDEEMPGWLMGLPQVRRLGPLFARQLGQNEAVMRRMYLNPDRILEERLPFTQINTQITDWDSALWEYLSAWSIDTDYLASRITDIQHPALIVTGDSDAVVPVSDSQRLDSELPNSELLVLPMCGHVPQEECPEDFTEAVSTWLLKQQ